MTFSPYQTGDFHERATLYSEDIDTVSPGAGSKGCYCGVSAFRHHPVQEGIKQNTLSPDARFWWDITGDILQKLASYSGYREPSTRNALEFYYRYIVESLGPKPSLHADVPSWRSFMTDDFSPVEFSWHWGLSDVTPEKRIRFSIEAIGKAAGSTIDSWNTSVSMNLVERLEQRFPSMKLDLFRRLAQDFIAETVPRDSMPICPANASPSTLFLGFELSNMDPTMKAYFLPTAKALQTGQSTVEIITKSMVTLAEDLGWASLSSLVPDLQEYGQSLGLQPFMIAIDCVELSRARMKIYVRSQDTSFVGVKRVMTMFDQPTTVAKGLRDLKLLWQLVFDQDQGFDETERLPHKLHETSGILYYLEVRPKSMKKTVKVYLPVKHYAPDDFAVVEGLCQFFDKTNSPQRYITPSFAQALNEICQYRRLHDGRGLQTYLSCIIKDNALDLCSYLSPEIYHLNRG
ncbi:MAG: hypothetical protein M1820_006539 [Bogoriella megaspora]|nr:MAG: hypothetical protein M1820_006539 [Bogoriella megaspora]